MKRAKKSNKYLKSFKRFLANDLQGIKLTIISHPTIDTPLEVTVIGETKNMLVVDGDKMLEKIGIYEVELDGIRLRFPGIYLIGTPRNRKKRRIRKW